MKKLLTVALALAALTILAPQASFAWNNQLGIYTDPAGAPLTANFAATPFVPFDAYLVLTNPVNHTFNGAVGTAEPITSIGGFECKVIMPESSDFVTLSRTFPVNAIDVGAPPSYVVGFATNVPVVNQAIVLCTWSFMASTNAQFDIFLDITRFPGLAGEMAVNDVNDPDEPLSAVYVSTGDVGVPVFSVNGTAAVAIENDTWGGVKSLYR
jgi:hypothetical protein